MLRSPVRLRLGFAFFLFAAGPAFALPNAVPLPADILAQLAVRNFGIDLEPACNAVYLDETFSTGYYVPAGAGIELADDLHTVLAGPQSICAFDLGYYNPGDAPVTATVTVYANGGADPVKGVVIAGPYLIHGLPPGANAFHIEVGGGTVLPHVWLGVAFDDARTGLLSFSPPTLGGSHDVVWITPPGVATNYGGQPPADFFLGLHSSPSTPARPSTWGNLKALYR